MRFYFGFRALALTIFFPLFTLATPTISRTTGANDSSDAFYQFNYTLSSSSSNFFRLFIDTDRSASTGYPKGGIGAEFLVENGRLYKHSGSGWSWSYLHNIKAYSTAGGVAQFTIARSDLGKTAVMGDAVNLVMDVSDSSGFADSALISQSFLGLGTPSVSSTDTDASYQLPFSGNSSFMRVFLDTDLQSTTGYKFGGVGAEYLIENGNLYHYTGTGSNWSWSAMGPISSFSKSSSPAKLTISRSSIGETKTTGESTNLVFQVSDGTHFILSNVIPQTYADMTTSGPSPIQLAASSLTTNGSFVMFAGTCLTGASITVSGVDSNSIAPTATNGCSAGKWFYFTNAQSTDGARSYKFSQKDSSGTTFTVTGTWTRDTNASNTYTRRTNTLLGHTSFPKLGKIAYVNSSYFDANLDHLSKMQLIILSMWPGYASPTYGHGASGAVLAIKAHNPNAIIANYTELGDAEMSPSPSNALYARNIKVTNENWWLRNAAGTILTWTSEYNTYDVNITKWAHTDSSGLRWPQWLAQYYYQNEFKAAPEIDMWYLDNVTWRERVDYADWKGLGYNQDNTIASNKAGNPESLEIASAYRSGQHSEWDMIRSLSPATLLIGNGDVNGTKSALSYPEYSNQLESSLIECTMGKGWSLDQWAGWSGMLSTMQSAQTNMKGPKALLFSLCMEDTSNYQQFRYAFASALMTNAYFDVSTWTSYSIIPWFDEFDVKLGTAIDAPPTTANIVGVDSQGKSVSIYKRTFSNGMAIVNPLDSTVTVTIPAGYKHISGSQASSINNGLSVTNVTLSAKDGIILVKQ